jgi:hypothetical protein
MARIGPRSVVAIPAATVGVGLAWLFWQVLAIREGNVRRDAERDASAKAIEAMQPKLDAIPRIQADVEWIRAYMARGAWRPPFSMDTAGRAPAASTTP